jgi:hypothetical protein
MDEPQRQMDIKVLAMMAARLAGRDPEQLVKVEVADFEGPIWRYPDLLERAEKAYALLFPSAPK